MGSTARSVAFQARTDIFPSKAWRELQKELGAKRSSRSTDLFPIWLRIDGREFTIWVSEIRLADSKSQPPIWEIQMESLSQLTAEGEDRWQQAYNCIESFFNRI